MARITVVQSARKDQGTCSRCGGEIKAGDTYRWVSLRRAYGSIKIKRCMKQECRFRPTDLSTSRMAEIDQAHEDADFGDTLDTITEAMQDFASTVRDVGDGYIESADNIEDGFGHATMQSDELREKGEALTDWADELENWEPSEEEPQDDDDEFAAVDPETGEQTGEVDQDAFDEKHQEWLDMVIAEADEAMGEVPV